MPELQSRIAAIESRLNAAGVSVARMLREADVTPSTWTRWKAGSTGAPRRAVWERVEAATSRLAPEPAEAA